MVVEVPLTVSMAVVVTMGVGSTAYVCVRSGWRWICSGGGDQCGRGGKGDGRGDNLVFIEVLPDRNSPLYYRRLCKTPISPFIQNKYDDEIGI